MAKPPIFRFFLSDEAHPVSSESSLWHQPLPDLNFRPTNGGGAACSYGDYFNAVARFVSEKDFAVIKSALAHETGPQTGTDALECVSVYLEKHGAVYHPSRVFIDAGGRRATMAVNVAVSSAGRRIFPNEIQALTRLCQENPNPWTPMVFGSGDVPRQGRDALPMFACQWFDGYHEFHLSRVPEEDGDRLRLWAPDNPCFFLNEKQHFSVYREAARILTALYKPETFEQVAMWHHAAGDFIASVSHTGEVALRLITIRFYSPMLQIHPVDAAVVAEGLLIFLIRLSIQNRLDRIDGVGEYVWLSDDTVAATLEGFFSGLKCRAGQGLMPEELAEVFYRHLAGHSRKDLMDVADAIVQRMPSAMPELPIISRQIRSHVDRLLQAVSDLPVPT